MNLHRVCLRRRAFALLLILYGSTLFAQFETATLTGFVTDGSGGVVANGTVRLSNAATNLELMAITDTEGRYTFTALRPGIYQLTAWLPGFKQFVSSGLTLQVNQSARVDVQLSVGDVSERIQVMATAPMLETETAARGAVIDQMKIVELPLNGRDYNQLALLSRECWLPRRGCRVSASKARST